MDNAKTNKDKEQQGASEAMGGDVKSIIEQLMGIDSLFQDFIDAESEGMIICENCYDTAFDDDEEVCTWEDNDGIDHIFCCKECMEEWRQEREQNA